MKKHWILTHALILSLAIGACSSTTLQPQEVEAVRDYVAATDLPEVSEIRIREQLNYRYLNDHFVILQSRRGDYLVEMQRRCFELRQTNFTPEMVDVRTNDHLIRPRFDTIRGCRIGKAYEITEEQAEELKALGDAPGDNLYMPDEEDEE